MCGEVINTNKSSVYPVPALFTNNIGVSAESNRQSFDRNDKSERVEWAPNLVSEMMLIGSYL